MSDFDLDDEIARENGLPGEDRDDDSDMVEVTMDEDQFNEAVKLRGKIRKAKVLFSDQPIFSSDQYVNMHKLHVVQLREMYQDIIANAQSQSTLQPWTLLYHAGNQTVENIAVTKLGINVAGATANNMTDPQIIHALKLIELEYGFEQVVSQNPVASLAIATAFGFLSTYQKNVGAPSQQATQQAAAQAATPISQDLLASLRR